PEGDHVHSPLVQQRHRRRHGRGMESGAGAGLQLVGADFDQALLHRRRNLPIGGKTIRLAKNTRWYQAGNFAQSEMCTGMKTASSARTSSQVAIGLRRLIQPVVIPAASDASAPTIGRAMSMRSVKSICF